MKIPYSQRTSKLAARIGEMRKFWQDVDGNAAGIEICGVHK